jgi:hypothetical protein
MQYVFMAYIYNLNAMLVHTMPSKNSGAMFAAFTNILTNLKSHGYAPTLNVMDNECSKAMEAHINSLTAISGPDRQLFFELRARVVSPKIFVRSQSLIAR